MNTQNDTKGLIRKIKAGLQLAMLFSVMAASGFSCDTNRPQVDLKKTTPDAGQSSAREGKILRIAVGAMISPETTRKYYEDLLRLIAARMGREAVFVQRRTYAEVNSLVRQREVDVAFVCSGPYTEGHDEFGMQILAVPLVHGTTVYHSYIIVHRGSPYKTFGELRGKKFAFVDQGSNTGYLVPAYMLGKQGETPSGFFRDSFFTHSHDNSIKAVAEGQADGAAVDSLIWDFFNNIDPELTSHTRIIEKSPPYGIPPIVVHPGLDRDMKRELKQVFLTLHEDKAAVPLLAKLQIDRFTEGSDDMYGTVREMSRWLASRGSR